jgi:hypothetical protein
MKHYYEELLEAGEMEALDNYCPDDSYARKLCDRYTRELATREAIWEAAEALGAGFITGGQFVPFVSALTVHTYSVGTDVIYNGEIHTFAAPVDPHRVAVLIAGMVESEMNHQQAAAFADMEARGDVSVIAPAMTEVDMTEQSREIGASTSKAAKGKGVGYRQAA